MDSRFLRFACGDRIVRDDAGEMRERERGGREIFNQLEEEMAEVGVLEIKLDYSLRDY